MHHVLRTGGQAARDLELELTIGWNSSRNNGTFRLNFSTKSNSARSGDVQQDWNKKISFFH